MAKDKFIIEPHFRLQEWVARGEGLLQGRRPRLRLPGAHQVDRRRASLQGRQGRRHAALRARPHLGRELRLPLDGRRRRLEGQGPALCRRLFGRAVRRVRAGGFAGQEAGGPRRRADRGRLPVGQPLFDHPGARAVHAARQDQSHVRGRHAVPSARPAHRRQGAGLRAVLRALLLRRAARLPQRSSTRPS